MLAVGEITRASLDCHRVYMSFVETSVKSIAACSAHPTKANPSGQLRFPLVLDAYLIIGREFAYQNCEALIENLAIFQVNTADQFSAVAGRKEP